MNWLRKLWQDLSGITFALAQAENERLTETNLVLEEENAKLRAEVRALVNTALGQAGVVPLPPAEEVKETPRLRHLSLHQQRRTELIRQTRTAISEAQELRKRFEEKNHVVPRSN